MKNNYLKLISLLLIVLSSNLYAKRNTVYMITDIRFENQDYVSSQFWYTRKDCESFVENLAIDTSYLKCVAVAKVNY